MRHTLYTLANFRYSLFRNSAFIYDNFEATLKNENWSRDNTFTLPSLSLLFPMLSCLFSISFIIVLAVLMMMHSVNAISIEGSTKDPAGPRIKDFHLEVDLAYD